MSQVLSFQFHIPVENKVIGLATALDLRVWYVFEGRKAWV